MLGGICKTCKECHPRDPEFFNYFSSPGFRRTMPLSLAHPSIHPFAPTIAPSYLSAHPLGKPRERDPSHNLGTVNPTPSPVPATGAPGGEMLLTDSSPRAKSSVNPS